MFYSFDTNINEINFFISFGNYSLLMYKNTTDYLVLVFLY